MTHDADLPVERGLRALYDVPVPASVDARIAAAIEARGARRSSRRWRRITSTRFLLAAVLATTLGITVAAEPVRELFSDWGRAYDLVYDVSTVVNRSVAEHGFRVTVVRAYADTSSLRLAVFAEEADGRGEARVLIDDAVVTDETGATYPLSEGAFGAADDRASESWLRFRMPEAGTRAGRHRFEVTVSSLRVERPGGTPAEHVAGPWSVAFDLDVLPVLTAQPGVTMEVAGVTVSFEELGVSPAATTGRLRFDGLPDRRADWAWDPWITVTHDCMQLSLEMLAPGSVLTSLAFEAVPGERSLAGSWTVTIDRFNRDIPDPSSDITSEEESILGPWVLRYEGPTDPTASPAPVDPEVCVSRDPQP